MCSKEILSAGPLSLFGTFTELALFVLQACTLAPAPPITAPQWSSSPQPLTPPLLLTCPLDNTDWTETSAALITFPRWPPWTAREMGESSVDVYHGCLKPWRCVILTLTLRVPVKRGKIINVSEGWEI